MRSKSKQNGALWTAVAAVAFVCVVIPTVSEAQSLSELAAKEKKRRAENDQEAVRVVDDESLGTVSGEGLSITGIEAETETSAGAKSVPATKPGATAPKSANNNAACIELAQVERKMAAEKRLAPSRSSNPGFVGHPTRSTAGMVTGVDRDGNVERSPGGTSHSARHPTPSKSASTEAATMRSAKLAELKKRWLQLRSECKK